MNDNLPTLTKERINELRNIRKVGFHRLGKKMEIRFKGSFVELFQSLHEESINPGSLFAAPLGHIIKYGSISDNMFQERFYRGENQIYQGDTNSKLGRLIKDKDGLTVYTYLLIEYLQIRILEKFLIDKNIRNSWKFGDIFVCIIAQHYGLETRYLDITDDIDVALFFANTREVEGKFIPIFAKDCNDDNKYAVLYCRSPMSFYPERIYEIGFQPFARCHSQRGFFIDTSENGKIKDFGLEKDHSFTKYKFLRDDELTREIFEQFKKGETLFPGIEKNILTNVIQEIKKIKSFTIEEVKEGLNTYSSYSYDEVVKTMNELGYFIDREINRESIKSSLKFLSFEDFVKREKINIAWREIRRPK